MLESVRMSLDELAAGPAEESHSLLCLLDGFLELKVCRRIQEREKTQERQKCKGVFNDYKTMSNPSETWSLNTCHAASFFMS